MEPSKKSQLLYKIFLRGYKAPNLANGNQVFRSNSYNFSKSVSEEPEQRYKRRQRNPDEMADAILPPPVEFGSGPASSSEEVQHSPAQQIHHDHPELDPSWTSETLEKRRDLLTDYFQRAILKQRREYDVAGAAAASGNAGEEEKFYESVCPEDSKTVVTVINNSSDSHVTPEPIYAEIYSDKELMKDRLMSPESCYSQLAGTESSGSDERVYENIDVIRHEMMLRQQEALRDPSAVTISTCDSTEDSQEDSSGEIDEESIIENKPAIKSYWETKMKENAASQFARSNFGTPSQTIIDRINEEIKEDYLRNLELMHDEGLPRSSASDTSDEPIEFDSFDMASGGGSPFGQPNDASSPILGESPTMVDSGHQSQQSNSLLDNENEGSDPESLQVPLQASSPFEGAQNGRSSSPVIYGFDTPRQRQQVPTKGPVAPVPNYNRDIVETNKKNLQGQGKVENNGTTYSQFNKPFAKTVKPFKELTPERDTRPITERQPVEPEVVEIAPVKKILSDGPGVRSSSKSDISYIIATTRLKKEIEDNLRREQELKEQGRVKTLSVETVTPVNPPASLVSPVEPLPEVTRIEEENVKIVEEKPAKIVEEKPAKSVEAKPAKVVEEKPAKFVEEKPTKFVEEKPVKIVQEEPKTPVTPPIAAPAAPKSIGPMRALVKPVSAPKQRPVSYDDSTKSRDYFASKQEQPKVPNSPNFKLGKNFNSLERYIMYSSLTKLNFRSSPIVVWTGKTNNIENNPEVAVANGTADERNLAESKKLSNSRSDLDEVPQEQEAVTVEKVRKNYIPTQKRIENELLEMMRREEELKRARQHWKSTPNLNNISDEDADAPVQHRPVVVPPETEKRRRSALISKWEDMISKNNQ